jgi:hypothetical protein
LRQDPGRVAEWLAGARTYGTGGREMRVLVNQQALFGRVAATLLIDAVSRER